MGSVSDGALWLAGQRETHEDRRKGVLLAAFNICSERQANESTNAAEVDMVVAKQASGKGGASIIDALMDKHVANQRESVNEICPDLVDRRLSQK